MVSSPLPLTSPAESPRSADRPLLRQSARVQASGGRASHAPSSWVGSGRACGQRASECRRVSTLAGGNRGGATLPLRRLSVREWARSLRPLPASVCRDAQSLASRPPHDRSARGCACMAMRVLCASSPPAQPSRYARANVARSDGLAAKGWRASPGVHAGSRQQQVLLPSDALPLLASSPSALVTKDHGRQSARLRVE
jgi:hypothetical protein